MSSSFSCSVECSRCTKRLKSSKVMWRYITKSHQLSVAPLTFLDEKNNTVMLTEPMLMELADTGSYNNWLSTITERVNEALHPGLPGKTNH